MSAPAVSGVIGGAQSEIKIAAFFYYLKLHLGEGFCKCCQPRIHWDDPYKCR